MEGRFYIIAAKDEINVPIAFSAFRDKKIIIYYIICHPGTFLLRMPPWWRQSVYYIYIRSGGGHVPCIYPERILNLIYALIYRMPGGSTNNLKQR